MPPGMTSSRGSPIATTAAVRSLPKSCVTWPRATHSQRMLRDFPALFAVTRDERFVTARHCLQSLWKVGCVGKEHQEILVSALERHFSECVTHKNCTLIRYDIIESLRRLFDAVHDDAIKGRALALIDLETDPKYKKKYLTLWPKRPS